MSEPTFIPVPPEIMAKMESHREENAAEPLGQVADRVLFEDEKVRVWEMRLEPGEMSDLHRHDLDYYLVILQGDLIGGIPPKDSGQDCYVAELSGDVQAVFVPAGDTEWAYNCGRETFYELMVELKK